MPSKLDWIHLAIALGILLFLCLAAVIPGICINMRQRRIARNQQSPSPINARSSSSSSRRSDHLGPFELEAPSRAYTPSPSTSIQSSGHSSTSYFATSNYSCGSEFTYHASDRDNSSPDLERRLQNDFEPQEGNWGVSRWLPLAQATTPSTVSETIARLSGKPNVKATMVLDRAANTILQTSGSFVSFRPVDTPRDGSSEDGVEEFAAMISKFVHTSGGLIQDLDTEDDVKLLRLRTKKHELVIVPDAKYIFVVVHDTPPA